MSNVNDDGRRYSLRVAGEEAPTSASDPFENNDFSNIFNSTSNTNSNSTNTNNAQQQSTNTPLTDDDLSLGTDQGTL